MAQYKVTVGDKSYGLNMPDGASQADIAAATDDFVGSLSQGSASQPAPAAPQAPPQSNTSLGNALGYGLHETVGGLGATAQVAGTASGQTGLQHAGDALESGVGAPAGYQPTDIAGSLRSGDVMGAVKQLPRAAVEAAPDLAGTLAAARVGGMLGPWGAAAGAGAYTAARMFGRNAQSEAQANHNQPEDNLGRAAAVTAGQSVLGAVGLGKAPGLSAAVESLPAVGRSVAKVGLETASGAAQDAVGQLGNSVGTVDGTKFDPAQSAAAGLQAGTARAAGEVVPLAKAGVKETSDQILSRTVDQPQHIDEAKSVDRVATAADAAQATDPKMSRLQALNSVKTEHVTNIVETLVKLRDEGVITPEEYRGVRTATENQAQRHNNTITEGGDNPSLYDAINNLKGAPPEVVTALKDSIRDLNTASTQSFAKNQTGPFQQLGAVLGKWGGVVGAATTGNVPELLAAGLGHSFTGKIGEALGKGVDNVMGTNTPKVDLQALAARRMLKDAKTEGGPSSIGQLQTIRSALDDVGISRQAQADAAQKSAEIDSIKKQSTDAEAVQQQKLTNDQTEVDRVRGIVSKQRDAAMSKFDDGRTKMPQDAPQGDWTKEYGAFAADKLAQTRDRTRAQGVLAKANAGTVDALAQSKVDKLAKGHSVTLAADGLIPTERQGSDPTADLAAATQSAMAADRTRALAKAGGPEAADRLEMGLTPFDPVAVDGLSPPRPTAPSSPSARRAPAGQDAAPAPTPQGAPEAPTASTAAPAFGSFTAKSQAHHWVSQGMKRDVSHAEFNQALAALHEDGIYTTHEHDELRDQAGSVTNLREAIKPVMEVLRAKDAGRREVGIPESALQEGDKGDKGQPRNLTQWLEGRGNYIALADGLIRDAGAAGHTDTKAALRQIKAESSMTGKEAIKDSLLADPDLSPAERAFATKTLKGKIMIGRDDRPATEAAPPPAEAPPARRKSSSQAVEIARQKAATTAALKSLVARKGT